MNHDGLIDDKTRQYLLRTDAKPGRFYILPKIHKPGNPGRPIVSSNSHPTERISQFVDYHHQPLVHKLPSFVKDTNDFLNKLLTIGNLPSNSLLVTLDVSSQYTLISHITKVLMLVIISYAVYVHALIITLPLAHSVTSFA